MKSFYQINKNLLHRNFDRSVEERGGLGSLNDPTSRDTMFSAFVMKEQEASKKYPGPYTQPEQVVRNYSTTSDQNSQVEFDPERKTPPPDRPRYEPDYRVPMPETEAGSPPEKHPNTVTQEDIDRVREVDPEAADVMEDLIKGSPHYQRHGDDGSSAERQRLFMGYYQGLLETLPAPSVPGGLKMPRRY